MIGELTEQLEQEQEEQLPEQQLQEQGDILMVGFLKKTDCFLKVGSRDRLLDGDCFEGRCDGEKERKRPGRRRLGGALYICICPHSHDYDQAECMSAEISLPTGIRPHGLSGV